MIQVFLNGIEIDIMQGGSVYPTYQLNTIGKLDDRQTAYTNKFKAPKTPKNIKAFGGYGLGVESNLPYKKATATIKENGIEILSEGQARITKYDDFYFNINIYGSEKNFRALIKSKTLKDVYPDTIINLGIKVIEQNISNNDNFIFTLIFNRKKNENDATIGNINKYHMEYGWTTPQFYVKSMLKYLFDYTGYSYSLDLKDDAFDNMLLGAGRSIRSVTTAIAIDFNLKEVVPEIPLESFLKEIMMRYALLMEVDERTKHVKLVQMNTILTGSSLDWSKKFHKVTRVSNKLSNYAKTNYFEFENDDSAETLSENKLIFENGERINTPTKNELRGFFSIENELLADEKTVYKSIFKKPKYSDIRLDISYKGRPSVYFLINQTEYEENGNEITGNDAFEKHLYYRKRIQANFSLEVWHGTSLKTLNLSEISIATFYETGFQPLADQYYQGYRQLLNKIEVITATIHLNVLDIHTLDFFKRIYIEQLGGYFYINKIKNFISNKLTSCELVRIPEITITQKEEEQYYYSNDFNPVGTL